MRIKVVLPMILLGGLILLVAYQFRPRPEGATTPLPSISTAPLATAKPVVLTEVFPGTLRPDANDVPAADTPATRDTAPADADNADDQVAKLEALAMNNDADSLHSILISLADPNRQIRDAALEAAIQFDSPDAIPSLEAALAQADDPQEKVNIQKAIEFLKLQPLTQADTADQQ